MPYRHSSSSFQPPKLPPPPTKAEVKKKEKEKKQKKKPDGPKRPLKSFAEPPPAVLQPEPAFEPPPTYSPAVRQLHTHTHWHTVHVKWWGAELPFTVSGDC